MKKALRIAALPIVVIVALASAGCEVLKPTYVPYTSKFTATSTPAPKPKSTNEVALLSREPVLGTPVHIINGVLNPGRVFIKIGATVTWVNHDKYTRNVLGSDWGSEGIPPGGRFSQQFNRAGSYGYHSLFNPAMAGEVIVQ